MNHIEWLHQELRDLEREGFLQREQVEKLRARYPVPESVDWGRLVFIGIGAILLGLGVILFFAYNWENLDRFVKLAIVIGSVLATHLGAIFFRRERPQLAEGLHLFGTMLFGAGVWLVAQIYHINDHYPNGFMIWALGALFLAWALPSAVQGMVVCILTVLWTGSEAIGFGNHLLWAPLLIAGVFPVMKKFSSRVLGDLIPISLLLVFWSGSFVPYGIAYSAMLLLSGGLIGLGILLEHWGRMRESGRSFWVWSQFAFLLTAFILSFAGHDHSSDAQLAQAEQLRSHSYFIAGAIGFLMMWGLVLYFAIRDRKTREIRPDLWVVLPVGLFYLLQSLGWTQLRGWESAVLYNLAILAQSVLLIRLGCREVRFSAVFQGCIVFGLLVAVRYTDLFGSLLVRSLVFLLAGAGFFITGSVYSSRKKAVSEVTK
ncbi:MAG: hypothetical protein A2603_13365 [Bdellovibrionales bacterium RIFOXYD1_FULL_55_31]|nr:MAG: hypothetical protein A2603_13365 [Bdellovibrionales bacterium RIFOXYD1_FULL_55_31]